jgi:hypothetical protein
MTDIPAAMDTLYAELEAQGFRKVLLNQLPSEWANEAGDTIRISHVAGRCEIVHTRNGVSVMFCEPHGGAGPDFRGWLLNTARLIGSAPGRPVSGEADPH